MDFIKFLGTAGARYAVIQQIRKSAGIWISLDNTNILIDPGPGCLVRCLSSKPKLKPTSLDGIILSHRHIDHSNDINIMIEAMTNGGSIKQGSVFAPDDAVYDDPVILHHFQNHVKEIITLHQGHEYTLKNIHFSTPIKHIHDVETYGLNMKGKETSISYIADTQYFDDIASFYQSDILILNVVLLSSSSKVKHLSVEDAKKIIIKNQPEITVLTHFGMTMIRSKPWKVAEHLSEKTGQKVIAASDGMNITLPLEKS